MDFTINNNLVFIDSMQFMNSNLHALVKNMSEYVKNMYNDFKYLCKEFSGGFLKLVKQEDCIHMSMWTVL